MVKAGKRGTAPPVDRVYEVVDPACDPVMDDVDELILSLDCPPAKAADDDAVMAKEASTLEAPEQGMPESTSDTGGVPWLDRYESTSSLINQLEDTLRMMESKGVNLTNAWELANTARSLLDSADVAQALIYANRSFRVALDTHRFRDSTGVAAS